MQRLNFPRYQFRLKNSKNKLYIFDEIRRKFVVLHPEEWVRQHSIQFLMKEKCYPKSLINVEKEIQVHQRKKRYDIVVFHPNGKIAIIVECKAPNIKITQEVFHQVARYNLMAKADVLMLTNGLNHYFCKIDYKEERYHFIKTLPSYTTS